MSFKVIQDNSQIHDKQEVDSVWIRIDRPILRDILATVGASVRGFYARVTTFLDDTQHHSWAFSASAKLLLCTETACRSNTKKMARQHSCHNTSQRHGHAWWTLKNVVDLVAVCRCVGPKTVGLLGPQPLDGVWLIPCSVPNLVVL